MCRHRSLRHPLLTIDTVSFSLLGLVSIQLHRAASGVRTWQRAFREVSALFLALACAMRVCAYVCVVCMCVCFCERMCTCMFVHVYTVVCALTHVHEYACGYMLRVLYIHVFVCTRVFVCVHMCFYVHL